MVECPVVVIGAGVGGLTSVKACLEEGLSVICYEKSNGFGGIWQYKEIGHSVTKTTILNSSKEWTAFSDFPVPADFPNYMPHKKYLEYLQMYVDHFDIARHLHFNRRVLHVDKASDYDQNGRWMVTVQNQNDDVIEVVEASAVVLCAGIHQQQTIPPIPGLKEEFQGQLVLSTDYKKPDGLEGRNVVIIGSGSTAFDTAVEVGKIANKVYLCSGRKGLLVNRIGNNAYLSEYYLSRSAFIVLNFCLSWLGAPIVNWISRQVSVSSINKLYDLSPAEDFYWKIVVINDEIPYRLISGQVVLKHEPCTFTKDSAIFKGEEDKKYPVDVIIVAAGFKQSTNGIFDDDILNDHQLIFETYRQVFPVHLVHRHSTVAVVGNIRPNAATAPMLELQARWIAQVFSKRIQLPSECEMRRVLEKERLDRIKYNQNNTTLYPLQFFPYVDEVAAEIGVKPDQYRLFFNDFRLWWAINFRLPLSAQFRLCGPHACPQAKNIILTSEDRFLAPLRTRPVLEMQKPILDVKFLFGLLLAAFILLWLFQ